MSLQIEFPFLVFSHSNFFQPLKMSSTFFSLCTHLTNDLVSVACFMLMLIVSSWNIFHGVWEAVLWMRVVFIFGEFSASGNNCSWGNNGTWLNANSEGQHKQANNLWKDEKNPFWSTREHTRYFLQSLIVSRKGKLKEMKTKQQAGKSIWWKQRRSIYLRYRPKRDIKRMEHDLQAILIRNLSAFFCLSLRKGFDVVT